GPQPRSIVPLMPPAITTPEAVPAATAPKAPFGVDVARPLAQRGAPNGSRPATNGVCAPSISPTPRLDIPLATPARKTVPAASRAPLAPTLVKPRPQRGMPSPSSAATKVEDWPAPGIGPPPRSIEPPYDPPT